MWELLEQLDSTSIPRFPFSIVANDIDDTAIQQCQQHSLAGTVQWKTSSFFDTVRPTTRGTEDALESTVVVCIGGPPYTTGAGSETMERDLPQRFLNHCLSEWDAMFVAFLLPKRYDTKPLDVPQHWTVRTEELSSCTFYFRGNERVTQPSVLQVYCAAEIGDGHGGTVDEK